MGHLNGFDQNSARRVRLTYYQILDALEAQRRLPFGEGQEKLKAAIIKRLMHLAADDVPHSDWTTRVLSSLPVR